MSSLPATRAGTVTPEVIECRDVKCACPNLEQRSVTQADQVTISNHKYFYVV